jgi:hypothetical protein
MSYNLFFALNRQLKNFRSYLFSRSSPVFYFISSGFFFIILLTTFVSFTSILCETDHTNSWKIGSQNPVTPIAYGIIKLHDHILFFLVVILFVVSYLLFSTYKKFYFGKYNKELVEREHYVPHIFTYGEKKPPIWVNLSASVYYRSYNINHGTTIEII